MSDTSLRDKVASKAVAVSSNNDRQPTIFDLVRNQREQVSVALPKGMDADRFTRLVITQMRQTPQLAQCTPASLLGSLMLSAQLGLEPGPLGHVWLIPRRKGNQMEVTFQLGYKGIIELARRSGQLSSIEAHEVCEADEFDFAYGTEGYLRHKPDIRGERGAAYAYYAVATFKDGGHAFVVLSRADVEKRKARSAAGDSGPWKTDYDAMARKTAVRALAPFLPLSAELQRAIDTDDRVYTRIEPDMAETSPPPGVTDDGEIIEADVVGEDGGDPGESE